MHRQALKTIAELRFHTVALEKPFFQLLQQSNMKSKTAIGQTSPKKYKPAGMVNWFRPSLLFRSALESVVSSLFGNYADRRETQAALDTTVGKDNELKVENPVYDYSQSSELWIDFVSDTADGFNSTFSVASTVARDLPWTDGKTKLTLPRGKLLVLGGDQIYPAPTWEGYEQKFKIPFKAALPYDKDDKDRPHLFAIPGNHDWYDGLGNFLKVFCQQRWIGNWETKQRRSYFALKLPHNYWLWGIDIQLNEDIDQPQKQYFMQVGKEMKQDDKVILVTAKPAWLYREFEEKNRSYSILQYFIEQYITDDKAGCMGNTFQLVALLTGDLHHYTHYRSFDRDKPVIHFIGAGGGGAALQLTHDLPQTLERVAEENRSKDNFQYKNATGNFRVQEIRQQKIYPAAETSKGLLAQNLLFFVKNRFFSGLFGAIYILVFWLVQSNTLANDSYMQRIAEGGWRNWGEQTLRAFAYSPVVVVLCVLLLWGFWSFGDNKKNEKQRAPKFYSLLFGVLICAGMFLSMWAVARVHNYAGAATQWNFWLHLLFAFEIFVAGFLIGGGLVGLYLYTSNLIFHNHAGEASAALMNVDYKNFLRLHLTADRLTIYPIGIDKVTKNWKQREDADDIAFTGDEVAWHLIEDPILIPEEPVRTLASPSASQFSSNPQ